MKKLYDQLGNAEEALRQAVFEAVVEGNLDLASGLATLANQIGQYRQGLHLDENNSPSLDEVQKSMLDQIENISFEKLLNWKPSKEAKTPRQTASSSQSRTSNHNGDRAPHGERTTEEKFRKYIIDVLKEMGGEGPTATVTEKVRVLMEKDGVLRKIDYSPLPKSGQIRWYITCCFARKQMIASGELDRNSPHGVWRLTNKK